MCRFIQAERNLPSLKLTHVKMDGWKRNETFWGPAHFQVLLLMGPWNPVNSPVEGTVVYPIVYRVLAPSQVVGNGISGTHQPYVSFTGGRFAQFPPGSIEFWTFTGRWFPIVGPVTKATRLSNGHVFTIPKRAQSKNCQVGIIQRFLYDPKTAFPNRPSQKESNLPTPLIARFVLFFFPWTFLL